MVQIVTVPQTVAGLTSSLGTSTTIQNTALKTALGVAGIVPTITQVGAVSITTHPMAYNNTTDDSVFTAIVWDGFNTHDATYGAFNTAPETIVVNGTSVTCGAGSVFTFNRAVIATAAYALDGYMLVNKAGGAIGTFLVQVITGVPYPMSVSRSNEYDAVNGLTLFSNAYSATGTYAAGDKVAIIGQVGRLLTATVTCTSAVYGVPAGAGTGSLSIVNHN